MLWLCPPSMLLALAVSTDAAGADCAASPRSACHCVRPTVTPSHLLLMVLLVLLRLGMPPGSSPTVLASLLSPAKALFYPCTLPPSDAACSVVVPISLVPGFLPSPSSIASEFGALRPVSLAFPAVVVPPTLLPLPLLSPPFPLPLMAL